MNSIAINNKMINTRGEMLWVLAAGVGCLIGLAGLASYLLQGHDAYNIYRQVPWGILISTYVYFAVCCTGLCLVSSLGHVFGFKPFAGIGKRAIAMAIIALLSGFVAIGLELGRPLALIYNLLSPNLAAPIWWMGTLYSIYLAVLVVEFFLMIKGHHRYVGYASLAGFIGGVAANSNLGSVFGFLDARVWWHGPYLPISIILTAAISGCAITILLFAHRYAREKIPADIERAMTITAQLFTMLLGILIFFHFWMVLTSVYGQVPGKRDAMMIMINGPLALSYWGFEVILGMLLPFALLLLSKGKSLNMAVAAAVSTLIGFFFLRYNSVVAGQLVPLRAEVEAVGADGLLRYAPSLTELAIVVGCFGLCFALYFAANRIFDLDDQGHH